MLLFLWSSSLEKWIIKSRKQEHRGNIFLYETIDAHHPTKPIACGPYDIIRLADWVNVVAITEDNKIVLVEQYRFGMDEITIETPAGAINRGEDPLAAAKRELEEETGYISDEWESLGRVSVNPAFMTNSAHFFLAKNCRPDGEQNFDPDEDIELVIKPVSELKEVLKNMDHSLSELCISRYLLK